MQTSIGNLAARFYRLDKERQQYIINAMAIHLRQAGRNQDLYQLIDKPWLELKRRQTHSDLSFATDVTLSIGAAGEEHPANITQVCRCALIYASLGRHALSVPLAVLGAWVVMDQADKARSYASLMQDPEIRGRAFLTIAKALLMKKEVSQAKEVLEEALKAVDDIRDIKQGRWTKARMLSEIAVGLAQAGSQSSAAATAERALLEATWVNNSEDYYDTSDAFRAVATAFSMAGTFNRALEIADQLPVAFRVQALSGVAEAYFQSGQLEKAKSVVAQAKTAAKDIGDESFALTDLVRVMVRANSLNEAIGIAAAIKENWERARATAGAALVLAQLGKTKEATEIARQAIDLAEKLPHENHQATHIGTAVEVLAIVGALDSSTIHQALQTIEGIRTDEDKVFGKSRIAYAVALAGDWPVAESLITQLPELSLKREEPYKSNALVRVAAALAAAGDIKHGVIVQDSIEKESYRIRAMSHMVEVLAGIDQDEARAKMDQLLSTVAVAKDLYCMDDSELNEPALEGLAPALARAGMFDEAFTVLKSPVAGKLSDREFPEIVLAIAQSGEFENAVTQSQQIENNWDRSQVLGKIVMLMMQRVEIDQAIDVALLIPDTSQREQVLIPLTAQMVRKGMIDRALSLVASMSQGPQYRVDAVNGIIEALAEIGEVARARKLIDDIENPYHQQDALVAMIRGLVNDSGIDPSLELMELLKDSSKKYEAQGIVVRALAAAGKFQQGLTLAHSIQDDKTKLPCFLTLARNGLQKGNFEQVADLLNEVTMRVASIRDPVQKVNVLGEIARIIIRLPDRHEAAMTAIKTLMESPDEIEDEERRDEALEESFQALMEMGRFEEAASLVFRFTDVTFLTDLLKEALTRYTQSGRHEQVLDFLVILMPIAMHRGREYVFQLLGWGAAALATMKQGLELWHTYQAIEATEQWWV